MLQHLPFFALSNRFFKNVYSTFYQATMPFDNAFTKMLISIQHYTFLPMMLVARFGAPLPLMTVSCHGFLFHSLLVPYNVSCAFTFVALADI